MALEQLSVTRSVVPARDSRDATPCLPLSQTTFGSVSLPGAMSSCERPGWLHMATSPRNTSFSWTSQALTTLRAKGRRAGVRLGAPVYVVQPFSEVNATPSPALTVDGLIALDIFEGSVNKEKFIHSVSTELVCMHITCALYWTN